MKIDLTWGESVAVREKFLAISRPVVLNDYNLEKLNYSPFIGDTELIEHTKKVHKRLFGYEPKHLFLTNGAAGGVTIVLRAMAQAGRPRVWIYDAPFFSLYPDMIKASGCKRTARLLADRLDSFALIDSPSNPEGVRRDLPEGMDLPVVWDAVYANPVYDHMALIARTRAHVTIASYSKYTGLNGIRIGWIALEDDFLAGRISKLVAAEYCGLSVPSVMILNQILPGFDWAAFELQARGALDANRELWSKLERYFGQKPVSPVGMFYYGPMDQTAQKLFEKAGVVWTPGSRLGHTDDFARFNIGQSYSLMKSAVDAVLAADKI